ncbi:hypothetical protein DIPPA_16313 [Diplonema papillatum]|nr:hypothetical protein DIPPA_16313 [Diplonema papillatum]
MLRAVRLCTVPLTQLSRRCFQQAAKDDDMSWLETDKNLSAEERETYLKQQQILRKHAEALNAQYETEYEKTVAQMESHQNRNASSVAALEAKIAELTSMIQQMKAENK